MATTAIFGAGVMGETLLSGLIRSGRDVADLSITEKRTDHAAVLNAKYGVSVLDNATAAKSADVLVLVVKPQDMDGLLSEIRDHVVAGNLVVSLAAGLFVDPDPGPVLANFGVDHLRFLTPVKADDTIAVKLTVKQITPRTSADYGEVRWDAVVTNEDGDPVATYDVLTLVAKTWPQD